MSGSTHSGPRKVKEQEIAAWQEKRTAIALPMEWRFTNEDARVKLKKLYPTIQK
jgi:hypothetical protein